MRTIHKTFSLSNVKLFAPEDIEAVYNDYIAGAKLYADNKRTYYFNIPCSFDIETTSFYFSAQAENKVKKGAIMYAWALGLNGAVIIGRKWEEFISVYEKLVELCKTDDKRRLRIYVHNMAFDFQFFRKWLSWNRVFSIRDRKVVEVETIDGIEFRCSYLLSGLSLAAIGSELNKYKVDKAVGDLDYNLIRHAETPLSGTEMNYILKDVVVVMAYIQERIEADGNIALIPLTKTGYVRKYCKNMCFYGEDRETRKKTYYEYKDLMKSLTVSADEYKILKRAFAGGLTHCNARYNNRVIEKVGSADLTSSYPTVMVSEKYPMSKGQNVILTTAKDFETSINKYCCIFDVYFEELEPIFWNEHILSWYKCRGGHNVVVDNGRVVSADYIYTTMTDVDFRNICKFYKWKTIKIANLIRYMRGYLPTNFVKSVLNLYKNKTELKGVEGKEQEYAQSKSMANATFGMSVTDIVRDDIIYLSNDTWDIKTPDIDEKIKQYNHSRGRFLFYPWGVFITAYARRNLISAIYDFNDDYIYSDTDSIKGVNYSAHTEFFEKYNNWIIERLNAALNYHGLDNSLICPKTIEGKTKPLGVWDYEGEYKYFKTLGAKRYMTFDSDNKFSITVSGLNKKVTIPYLLDMCKIKFRMSGKGAFIIDDETNLLKVFDLFDEDLYIPPDYTGKNTHKYIDDEIRGNITDYKGNSFNYYERSGVHLSKAEYSLSLSQQYIDYLKGIKVYKE